MSTIQLQPLSVLAGVCFAWAAALTIGQEDQGTLEAQELRIVDADGAVRARIGSSDTADVGLWMVDQEGVERLAIELTTDEGGTVSVSLLMRNRAGEDRLEVSHEDGRHHGDTQHLILGVASMPGQPGTGFAVDRGWDGASLSLTGENGSIEMDYDYSGPFFHMQSPATEMSDTSWPDSHIYLGRQNFTGATNGSLAAIFTHGLGRARLAVDPEGRPELRMTNADDEVVGPERP